MPRGSTWLASSPPPSTPFTNDLDVLRAEVVIVAVAVVIDPLRVLARGHAQIVVRVDHPRRRHRAGLEDPVVVVAPHEAGGVLVVNRIELCTAAAATTAADQDRDRVIAERRSAERSGAGRSRGESVKIVLAAP